MIRAAYDKLTAPRYPLKLPFDLWLETVRQFCDYAEAPLAEVLEALRPGPDLFSTTHHYDRAAIFYESLGLSPSEVAIFTDPDPLARGQWCDLYGYATTGPAIANPTNAAPDATLTLPNNTTFEAGNPVTYATVAAGVQVETHTIKTVGGPDSGGAGQRLITLNGVWTTPPTSGDRLIPAASVLLSSAKTLARRMEVTYKELVEIVKTGFVNPHLAPLALLYKLDLAAKDVFFYETHRAFYLANQDLRGRARETLPPADQARYDALANDVPNTNLKGWDIVNEIGSLMDRLDAAAVEFAPFDARAWLDNQLAANVFDDILVLADPDAGCSFDATTLRYADGRPAAALDFVRINLFVRLWRKLGWTIEELDRSLTTFVGPAAYTAANLGPRLRAALLYLAHLKALDNKLRPGKGGRLKLLTLWSDIPTTGKKPLYAQLFLGRSVAKSGEVDILTPTGQARRISLFDNALGRYLDTPTLEGIAEMVEHVAEAHGVEPAVAIDPAPFAGEARVRIDYDPVTKVQTLGYRGRLIAVEKARLAGLPAAAGLPQPALLSGLLDGVEAKGQAFSLIKGHLPGLQGALGLTALEIEAILKDAGQQPETAPLTVPNVSVLYRYGLLAKALKLSVADVITLKVLAGRNPFKPLAGNPPTVLADDYPFSETLRFVEIVGEVKASGVSITELDYLLRHRFDATGPHRQDPAAARALLTRLAEGIRAIRAEHAVPADPTALTDEVLRAKLALSLTPDAAGRFMDMVNGTALFVATRSDVNAAAALTPADFAAASAIVAVSQYNAVRTEQKLTYRGVLLPAERAALQAQFGGLPAGQRGTLAALLDNAAQQALDFFDSQLRKQPLRRAEDAGFLDRADFDVLFAPLAAPTAILPGDTPAEVAAKEAANAASERSNQAELRNRRMRTAAAYLPYLQARLIRQLVVQTLAAYGAADPALVESLLTDERLLHLPAPAPVQPLLAALTAPANQGVDVAFFASNDLTGAVQASAPRVRTADTGLKDAQDLAGAALPAAGSARFVGYLQVPAAGPYRFYVELDKTGAAFELRFEHRATPLFLHGVADVDNKVFGTEAGKYLELQPGAAYSFTLAVRNLGGGHARLLVQGETLPKGPLSQLALYPAQGVAAAEQALLLLTKALRVLQVLGLSEREARYLLADAPGDFDNVSLSELPTGEGGDTPAERIAAAARCRAFLRLAAYVQVRRDLAEGTNDLIDLFEAQAAGGPAAAYPILARLTRREPVVIEATARTLWPLPASPSFVSEKAVERLWAALQLMERFGATAATIQGWTRIVSPASVAQTRSAIAAEVRETIKARFAPEAWQGVAQPIFDRLRRRQRDALVAHVMHTRGFARLEELYEYFLIDPGMEPVVQTSRIRLAISSVQLFLQRCLLNLEAKVHPSAILNPEHWEWMKRYRVWEANRKIFLFPENWLEPEFRDDKSHLFAELEGALLQGDVSRDLVEDAFLNYLRKLDELARLDIVAMHVEQRADPGQNVLHVFGRTYAEPHKYFYRRFSAGGWTPWEAVTAEIQGDHLAPVIWRDRLYLFWVTFMEKAEQPTQSVTIDYKNSFPVPLAPATYVEAQLHWSEYLHGTWTTHESSGLDAASVIKFAGVKQTDVNAILTHVSKAYSPQGDELGVFVHLNLEISTTVPPGMAMSASLVRASRAFYLAGRNSSPAPRNGIATPAFNYPSASERRATRYRGTAPLTVSYTKRTTTEPNKPPERPTVNILGANPSAYTLLPLNHGLGPTVPDSAWNGAPSDQRTNVKAALERTLAETESLIKPLFYQDDTRTFFVEPDVVERTMLDVQTFLEPVAPPTNYEEPKWHEWLEKYVEAQIPGRGPKAWPPEDPLDVLRKQDWLVNEATIMRFDDAALAGLGAAPITFEHVAPESAQAGVRQPATAGTRLYVSSAGAIEQTDLVVLGGGLTLSDVGLAETGMGLNVIGAAGVNAGVQQNVESMALEAIQGVMTGMGR